ncbi:MAG: hypothetical protein H0W06_08815 [Chloroflexia bacterium]|nr:hypothetical protein [Chloroflexia bacterium]
MATQAKTPQQEALDRLVERSRKEIKEARRQYDGDPDEALDSVVRQIYDEETLRQMLKYLLEGRSDWDDEEDELADAG